jgi:ankyrin repeat protein
MSSSVINNNQQYNADEQTTNNESSASRPPLSRNQTLPANATAPSSSSSPTLQRQTSATAAYVTAPVTAFTEYLKHIFGLNAQTTKRSLSEEAECGSPESLSEWLRQGSNANEIDAYGYTPLVNASLRGCIKSVKILLNNGADINMKAMHGYSALHAAAQVNFFKKVFFFNFFFSSES